MLVYKTLNITSDISQEFNSNQSTLVAVQGDINCHRLLISFIDGLLGKTEIDFSGWELTVRYIDSDLNEIEDFVSITKEGAVYVIMNQHLFDNPSSYTFTLTLTNPKTSQIIVCPKIFKFKTKQKINGDVILQGYDLINNYIETVSEPAIDDYVDAKQKTLDDSLSLVDPNVLKIEDAIELVDPEIIKLTNKIALVDPEILKLTNVLDEVDPSILLLNNKLNEVQEEIINFTKLLMEKFATDAQTNLTLLNNQTNRSIELLKNMTDEVISTLRKIGG